MISMPCGLFRAANRGRPFPAVILMEMHQVRYFLAVAETLNFTRAAERCNVSQPALTRAIQNLEGEFGGLLFRRERNLTHLTELGRLVVRRLCGMGIAPPLDQAEAGGIGSGRRSRRGQRLDGALRLSLRRTLSAGLSARRAAALHMNACRDPNLDPI